MITFKVPSELYGVTDCVITDIDRTLKTGYAPCGSGEDYKFTPDELAQLARINKGEKIYFIREVFSKSEILKILSEHPLVQLKEKPLRVFVVGSFVKGTPRQDSDIDVMIEVKSKAISENALTDKYRDKIRKHFIKNKIMTKADEVHPNYKGRRIDLYLTYNADQATEHKIELFG